MSVLEPNEGNAFIGGTAERDVDRPAACLPQLAAGTIPSVADMKTGVGNQPREFRMIDEFLAGLLKCVLDFEDEQRMPPGGATASEDDATGVVRGKPAGSIVPRPGQLREPGTGAVAKMSRPRDRVTMKAAD
jgi:hypothetical protein